MVVVHDVPCMMHQYPTSNFVRTSPSPYHVQYASTICRRWRSGRTRPWVLQDPSSPPCVISILPDQHRDKSVQNTLKSSSSRVTYRGSTTISSTSIFHFSNQSRIPARSTMRVLTTEVPRSQRHITLLSW